MKPFAFAFLFFSLISTPVFAQFKGGGGGGARPGGGGIGGGGFNPGGGGGARPNPGGGGFNPGGGGFNPGNNRPNPGGFNPGGSPPGVFNPTGGGFNPGVPHGPSPSTPMQVRNPFVNPTSRIVPPGVPIQVANPNLPTFGGGKATEFAQARNFARNNDGPQLTNFLNKHMQANANNLPGMFSAVNALHGVNNPAYAQLRTSTFNLAQQQIAQGANQPTPYVVVAQMSLQDRNPQKFNEATQNLMQRFPNSEYTHFFRGVQHLQNRDFKQAEEALQKARDLGMPEESIADLLRVAIDNQKWIWEYALVLTIVVGVWLFGLFALFIVGKLFSMRTLANLHRAPEEATTGDRWLRAWYRRVIALAGFYYYLSLPMVLIIAIALPLALGYAMLMVPYLNMLLVGLILLVGLTGIITAISGVRTAFLRVRPFEDGRNVSEQELPELWQVAREVAEKVGTRPVDEIRLTWSTDLCVFEKGSWRDRRRDKAQRVLVLGVGALRGMKRDALKSILAHEYGHFQNRDTAGGDIALRVNLAMRNFAQAIVKRGKIRWWDLAVHFLRFYHFMFRRLTFGASRLQEVYADRLAVQLYGATALREGLTHVIRRTIEFDWSLNKTLDTVIKTGQPALNFFHASPIPELREREQIETVVNDILDRATDAEDSHPSPKDRFRLADRIDANPRPLANDYAWGLLAANAEIVSEMNQKVEKILEKESETILDDVSEGIQVLSKVLRRQFNPDALLERARLYLNTGEYGRAIDDLTEILEVAPRAIGVRYMRGIAYKRLEKFQQAIPDLEDVASRVTADGSDFTFQDPDFTAEDQVIVLLSLGECMAAVGNHAAALRAYAGVVKRRRSSLAALVGRGKAHAALGDSQRARADFEAAMEKWPGSPEPVIELGKLRSSSS